MCMRTITGYMTSSQVAEGAVDQSNDFFNRLQASFQSQVHHSSTITISVPPPHDSDVTHRRTSSADQVRRELNRLHHSKAVDGLSRRVLKEKVLPDPRE